MSALFRHPYRTAPDTLDAIRADLAGLVNDSPDMIGSVDQVGVSDVVSNYPNAVGVVADAARAIYLRRALEEAADHAAAMLPALDLPRLVELDFVPVDPVAAADAIDAAVAALDALDADPDLEPWLGWTGAAIGRAEVGDTLDREAEDLDEFTLGWSALHSQATLDHGTDDGDITAPERAGRGFVRCGPDDVEEDDPPEDGDPAERDDEHGSEDAEDIAHHASQHAPRPLRAVDREAVAIIAARAAQARRTLYV